MRRTRRRSGNGSRKYWIAGLCLAAVVIGAGVLWSLASRSLDEEAGQGKDKLPKASIFEGDGVKQVSRVVDGKLALYREGSWEPVFWTGMNLGATTPGHYPGELTPTKDDYLRWFQQIKEMNTKTIRIYTILPPSFYQALEQFNEGLADPLYVMHGIWSPEEELIGEDGAGRNAYTPEIMTKFISEIKDAVAVVNGDAVLPVRPGHASGTYTADVSRYVAGWVLGTEWYPYAVQVTNESEAARKPYQGTYFRATEEASPFESWLTQLLDTLAAEEMKYGWQHPLSFTNWLTTDPLEHPNEPLAQEDLVSVDPMHIQPAATWTAGYFAAYHVYPYYPDFLSYEPKYQTYKDTRGEINPYAGYLRDLREHHSGMPLIVAEYGVPSSRGMAHHGPAGRDQGMHTELEQGQINADMTRSIYEEGYDGAFLFEWHNEWFKFTWNTVDMELPNDRRAYWRNRLTNEEHFGMITVEPGPSQEQMIVTDGETDDWTRRADDVLLFDNPSDMTMRVIHDESDLHLVIEKKSGEWDFSKEELYLGFSTIAGGSTKVQGLEEVAFSGDGLEFLASIRGKEDARILVNSGYDLHTWYYGAVRQFISHDPQYGEASAGIMLPWRLALNKGLYLPETKENIPFEDIDVGVLRYGNANPGSESFDSLADWYVKGKVLELRIPWMLLGFTDPSTHQVWAYPYAAGEITPVTTEGIRIAPYLRSKEASSAQNNAIAAEAESFLYTYSGWNEPKYHERMKQSYPIMKESFASYDAPLVR